MNRRNSAVMYLDNIAKVLLLLILVVCYKFDIITIPYSLALLLLPLSLSMISTLLNWRLAPSQRVSARRFGCFSYWHPYCTLIISFSVILTELPFGLLNMIGNLTIILTVGWSFIRWIKSER